MASVAMSSKSFDRRHHGWTGKAIDFPLDRSTEKQFRESLTHGQRYNKDTYGKSNAFQCSFGNSKTAPGSSSALGYKMCGSGE